ncbi:MAG: transglutaminase family protein [SAR324 cluster bacterium]|nr:transglutaminase family protein [SAR324 cluster bacterium]
MNYQINHQTIYNYSELASISQNELFLFPRETEKQKVIQSTLNIFPKPQYTRQRVDYFGNITQVFMVQHPHNELSITASSRVMTLVPETPVIAGTPPWESVVQRLGVHEHPEELDAYQYVFISPQTAITSQIKSYAQLSFPPGMSILAGAVNLTNRIFTEFSYDESATTVDTPVEQVLLNKKGVCQDFAHFAISCLRSLGMAARYVSGYLETAPPPGKPKMVGADASHAWFALFVPGTGWVDLDPTNNIMTGEQHITVAWGRDYTDVTPVKGVVMGGGSHSLSVKVDVSADRQCSLEF